jgi:hypothetical protein
MFRTFSFMQAVGNGYTDDLSEERQSWIPGHRGGSF